MNPVPRKMMNPNPPKSDQKLTDPNYRAEMLTKIEALISVLQVARAKVVRNLATPGNDSARLARVKLQVENTLSVCRKAQTVLRGSAPISEDEIFNTDIDALCSQLSGVAVS